MPFHSRYNEQRPSENPNPHVQYIRALPGLPYEDDALSLLRALAAQVKPLCKKHGLGVNSLEEFEWNTEFAGRNWNGGEVVELVLRRPDGSFAPIRWLTMVMCHELAHIHHMNHGKGFQQFNAKLRSEVAELQAKGFYGDGFYSDGKRLKDGIAAEGDGVQQGIDVPEYLCGGAAKRKAPRRRYRRRAANPTSASAASTKRRKPGGRVKRKDAFVGEGQVIDADQSSFRRRTQSKAAGAARALAAERRLRHEARRQHGEPSDTDAAPGDELESEDEAKAKGKGKATIKKEQAPFRDEGSSTEDDDGEDGDRDGDIALTAEERRWLKEEAAGMFKCDDWAKPKTSPEASTSESAPKASTGQLPPKASTSSSGRTAATVISIDDTDDDDDDDEDLPDRLPAASPGKRARLASPLAKAAGPWSCSACTFLNDAGRPHCSVCETPR